MPDEVTRLLSGIPRESAPEIPVEGLLRRAAGARRRALLLMSCGVLGLAALAVGLARERVEAPIHLNLRVVEVTAPPEDGTRPARSEPEEFERP